MDKYKDWYSNKNGKMILFFGFYLIFFIFLAIYMRNINTNNKAKNDAIKEEEKITTYNLSNLINNDYEYNIIILDNDETIAFNGTKNNIDYANYSNKYFLDIYNINQLLKKSKFVDSNNLLLSYELSNSELNELLLTEREEGTNKIDVSVNTKGEVQKVSMDLKNYLDKEKYQIVINYIVGEENENSPS